MSTKFSNSITGGFAAVGEPNVAVCLLPGTEVAFENAWARLLQKPSKDPNIRTSDADPAFDGDGNTDRGLHGGEAFSDQRTLGHQAESKIVRG